MKLLTIDCREIGGRPGVVLSSGDILDLAAAPSTLNQAQWIPYSIVSVLAAGREGLDRVAALVDAVGDRDEAGLEQLRRNAVVLPADGTALMPPVRRPGLVLVLREDGSTYLKSPNTAVGNAATVEPPWNQDAPLECSGMLAAVIGRPLYRGSQEDATDAIAGWTLYLDLASSGREDPAQQAEHHQFPGAGPMGPAIVTIDELPDPGSSKLALSMNDVIVASESAYACADDPGARLAEVSQRYSFRPGDLVCFEPAPAADLFGCRTHPGDAVRLSVDDVMSLDIAIAKA